MILSRVFNPVIHFDDDQGHPLSGGRVYTYLKNSTTPAVTYANNSGAHNTNPIILNSRGEAEIWLDPTKEYKFVVKDHSSVVTQVADNIKAVGGGYNQVISVLGDDVINAETNVVDDYKQVRISVNEHSISRELLKGTRDIAFDDDYFNVLRFGEDLVLTLSDSFLGKLRSAGVDV